MKVLVVVVTFNKVNRSTVKLREVPFKYPPLLAKPLNRGGGRWSGRVAVAWPPPVKRPDKSSSRMHAALLFLPRNKSTDGPRRITLFILNRGLAE